MTKSFVISVCLLLTASFHAAAKDHGKGKGRGKPSSTVVVFTSDHHTIIRDYIRVLPASNLPPGLAKRGGALPPGLEKQLRKNGRLPPGLEKEIYFFPLELERRLPPLGPDLRRAFIGGRAVIYNSRTSVVIDVFVPL